MQRRSEKKSQSVLLDNGSRHGMCVYRRSNKRVFFFSLISFVPNVALHQMQSTQMEYTNPALDSRSQFVGLHAIWYHCEQAEHRFQWFIIILEWFNILSDDMNAIIRCIRNPHILAVSMKMSIRAFHLSQILCFRVNALRAIVITELANKNGL